MRLPFPVAGPSKAFLIDSVVATITASGPAAATRPFRDAMLSRDEVGAGRLSEGHGVGNSCTLASPAKARNPSA